MSNQAVLLRTCAICDDVRREDNSKFILIGLYTSGPRLYVKPQLLALSLFASFVVRGNLSIDLEFGIVAGSFEGKGKVGIQNAENNATMDVALPFSFVAEEDCDITFKWKTVEEEEFASVQWHVTFDKTAVVLSEEQAAVVRKSSPHIAPTT